MMQSLLPPLPQHKVSTMDGSAPTKRAARRTIKPNPGRQADRQTGNTRLATKSVVAGKGPKGSRGKWTPLMHGEMATRYRVSKGENRTGQRRVADNFYSTEWSVAIQTNKGPVKLKLHRSTGPSHHVVFDPSDPSTLRPFDPSNPTSKTGLPANQAGLPTSFAPTLS
jgi:hypothetical protein